MIDDMDISSSTLRMLVSEALKSWNTNALLGLLEDEDVIVRTAVARELQLRGESLVFKKMQDYATSDRDDLREIAAFVLGQLGTPSMPFRKGSFSILLQLASDTNSEVRSSAAAAFGHLCYDEMPTEVESCLVGLCSDADHDVRACAAYALGNSSGGAEIRDLLTGLLKQDYVGSYAELALEVLDEKGER